MIEPTAFHVSLRLKREESNRQLEWEEGSIYL